MTAIKPDSRTDIHTHKHNDAKKLLIMILVNANALQFYIILLKYRKWYSHTLFPLSYSPGRGAHQEFQDGNSTYYTPKAKFTVQGGKKYRFRVISNGVYNCPIQVNLYFYVQGRGVLQLAPMGKYRNLS